MRNQKLHAVVARSTFPSPNDKNTTCSDYFWKLAWSARVCGAKRMCKPKCQKNAAASSSGTLLEVQLIKKCTRLWREAHVEVKMQKKKPHVRKFGPFFGVGSLMGSAPSHMWEKHEGLWQLQKKMAGVGRLKKTCTTLHCTSLHYTRLPCTTPHFNYNYKRNWNALQLCNYKYKHNDNYSHNYYTTTTTASVIATTAALHYTRLQLHYTVLH